MINKINNDTKAWLKAFYFIALISLVGSSHSLRYSTANAKPFHMNYDQFKQIQSLAKAIYVVNPTLEESKYLEYAYGIHRAARKYQIDPIILISIAQQETGFRENLPEGKAGEIGICQIRKNWLNSPRFKAEFRKQTIKDLHKPSKNFLFAAWLLKELKAYNNGGSIPFWSYYNSVKFENRFKYFVLVNKNISAITHSEVLSDFTLDQPEERMPYKQAKMERSQRKLASTQKQEVVENTKWIPDAIKKIQTKEEQQDRVVAGNQRKANPSLIRAAQMLEVGDLFPKAIIAD